MAEGNGLLNRHTLLRRIEGSNPSVSAMLFHQFGSVSLDVDQALTVPEPGKSGAGARTASR